jgi:hypothetical protein
MSLIATITEEILSDDTDQSNRLQSLYENGTEQDRKAIDEAMMCVCGWTLETLIQRAGG